jgi:selenocysteine-specific translation elongation factor
MPAVAGNRITVELTLEEAKALEQAWLIKEFADFPIEVTEAEVDALERAQKKLRAAISEQS